MARRAAPAPVKQTRNAERSRAKILEAAREQFAALGFDKATVRAIAAQAGLDPALVIRYFTSKELLFNEAVFTDPRVVSLSDVPRSKLGAAVATAFVQRWANPATVALLRSVGSNQVSANEVHVAYTEQLVALAAQVGPSEEAGERGALIASQIVGLALSRYVLELEPLPSLSLDALAQRIAPVIQHYLTQPLGKSLPQPRARRAAAKS